MPTITRIEIRDFGGIREIAMDVPSAGMLIKGGNRRGKTSIVRALRAALEAEGIDAGAIRDGADRAEIFVDIAAVGRVRQTINAEGKGSVSIRNELGDTKPSPRTYLQKLFGRRLDPLAFYLAKADERQKIVLEAMPCTVTTEDQERWCGKGEAGVLLDLDRDQHGVFVLKQMRDRYYNRRTDANARAATTKAEAARLDQVLRESDSPEIDQQPTVADAQQALADAEQAAAAAANKLSVAAALEQAAAKQRARVAELRAQADEVVAKAPLPDRDRMVDQMARIVELTDEIEAMEAALEKKRDARKVVAQKLAELEEVAFARARAELERESLLQQAVSQEESIARPPEPITEADVARARSMVDARRLALDAAQLAEAVKKLRAQTELAHEEAGAAKDAADRLDGIVKTLTNVAPKEIAARANTIPGFDPDAMSLDNVPLDRLSGAEQMGFAIALAKRANPKSKLLICDGLERIDTEQEADFLKLATEGGWQIIGTRVTSGVLDIEAIGEEG